MRSSPKTDGNIRSVVPLLSVQDMEQSLRYYLDGLRFTMRNKWVVKGRVRWCWLERGGAALMLQEFAKQGHDSWIPQGKVGEGVSLYFICDDALALYAEITSRFIEASEPQVGNGMWVTTLSDPDGYRIHFESTTDIPEDTRLSELGEPPEAA